MPLDPTPEQIAERDRTIAAVLASIAAEKAIRLPPFVPGEPPSITALHSVAGQPNPFGGSVGEFRYQFEGEDDVLHFFVTRGDGSPLGAIEAQEVLAFALPSVEPGLVWIKPGTLTQHFYFGHELVQGWK